MSKMKHVRSLLSFLISLFMILSVVVFPAAERCRAEVEGDGESSVLVCETDPAVTSPPTRITAAGTAADAGNDVDVIGAPVGEAALRSRNVAVGSVQPAEEIPTASGQAAGTVVLNGEEGVLAGNDADPNVRKEARKGSLFPVVPADTDPAEDSPAVPSDEPEPVFEPVVSTDEPASSPIPAGSRRDELALPTIDTVYPLEFDNEYSGMLTSVDERHIYPFSVPERGFLQYTVKHAEMHNFMGWDVTLYQEYFLNGVDGEVGYRPLNLLQTTALATTEASPTVGIMPGKYRVVVKTTGGIQAEEYTLSVVFTADHTHEIECNDTKAAYTELYANIPMVGSASCYSDRQDDDWYLLRVQNNGSVRLVFRHGTADNVSVAWRVALYSEAGEELYAENSGMNKEEIDSGGIGVAAGVYFVAVLGRVRCDQEYTLTVTAAADDKYERENNDSMETANPLSNGGTVKGCVSAKAGRLDRDFFRFEMPARGNFSMVFTHDAPPAEEGKKIEDKNGWNVRLLSASGELLYSMVSTWHTPSVSMPAMGLEDGVYYIEINSEDLYRNTTTYTLTAGNTQSSSFETEPNNTPEQATPIANGVPVTGAIIDSVDPDDDYYSFTVPASSRVTVLLKHEATEKERDIFRFSVWDDKGEKMPLYSGGKPMTGADGKNVYYIDSLGTQPTVSGLYELPAGTYYIKVTSGRFFQNIDYMLQFYFS